MQVYFLNMKVDSIQVRKYKSDKNIFILKKNMYIDY